MEPPKKVITMENILCFFLILCPILDVSSFLFRNAYQTSLSISTMVRPVIPILAMIYIFVKEKRKISLLLLGAVYAVYGILHLYIFTTVQTGSSYSNILHEAQYVINYTFVIVNLLIYLYIFAKKDIKKLKISMLISSAIYIFLMFLAILTKTSSYTYPEEQIGLKGWFESGNSISAILILSLFILLPMLKEKKYSIFATIIIVGIGIYLTTCIGTRVGLFGFFLVVFGYLALEICYGILHNIKLSKKMIAISGTGIAIVLIIVIFFGSATLIRRKNLQQAESTIIDQETGKAAHVTGDLLEIKKQIEAKTLPEGYLSKTQEQSILDLHEMAEKYNISNTDMRAQQFFYQISMIKNQKSFPLLLFGNGYVSHFRELVFEMEVPAFLFNFGIIGSLLYFIPFWIIAIYGMYIGIKKRNKITVAYVMELGGICFAIVISFLSGYTFFSTSTMMMVTILATILIKEIIEIRGGENEKNYLWNH